MKIKPFVMFLEDFQYMLIEEIDFNYNLEPILIKGKLFEININTGKAECLGEYEAQFSIALDALRDSGG